MAVEVGNPARFVAWARWGMCRVLTGRGPGRHPFAHPPYAPYSAFCGVCAKMRGERIHMAPKRRKCAAFGKSATVWRPLGPGNSTPPPGTPLAP